MKKVIGLFAISLLSFFLSGCFSKTDVVKCMLVESNYESTITGYFKNDEFVKIEYDEIYIFEQKENLDKTYKSLLEDVSEYNNIEGISAEVKNTSNIVSLKVLMDASKIDMKKFEIYFGANKSDFERIADNEGYTCK